MVLEQEPSRKWIFYPV